MSGRLTRMMYSCAIICLALSPGPAFAQWDFFTGVTAGWMFGHYSQLGGNGFFGPSDFDASTNAALYAGLNGWVGNHRGETGELVSGSNAAVSRMDVKVKPSLSHNWATIRGQYIIETYDAGSTEGSFVAMSPGQLTMWSISADTPIVRITHGKRNFQRAFGLQFGYSRSKEYLSFQREFLAPNFLGRLVSSGVLPRGVLSWSNPARWPRYRRREKPTTVRGNERYTEPEDEFFGEQADESGNRISLFKRLPFVGDKYFKGVEYEPSDEFPTDADPFAWGHYSPGRLILTLGLYPWQGVEANPTSYWNRNDLNAVRVLNFFGGMQYVSSDLTFGWGGLYIKYRLGPESIPDPRLRGQTPSEKTAITEGWFFLRYNNGLVFLNTEVDVYHRMTKFHSPMNAPIFYEDGSGRGFYAPQYRESWRYMIETGGVLGATGLRFLYAFMPGPDRRHGIRINRQPFIRAEEQEGRSVFEPYIVLMGSKYGAGGDYPGDMSDATVVALKVEYAVAANLWFEGSYARAWRNSHGYGWGYIRPLPCFDLATPNADLYGRVDYGVRGTFRESPPAIPNNDLGWEVTTGVVWELLNGWVIQARGAYWQPGPWFNFACIDRSVANWQNPGPGNNWGTNPDRGIDPVAGFELRFAAAY